MSVPSSLIPGRSIFLNWAMDVDIELFCLLVDVHRIFLDLDWLDWRIGFDVFFVVGVLPLV